MRPKCALHRQAGLGHLWGTRYQLPSPPAPMGRQGYPARRPRHSQTSSTGQSVPQIRRDRVTENSAFAIADRRYPTADLMSAIYPRRLNRPGKRPGPGTSRAVVHRILGWARPKLRDIHYRCPTEDVFIPVRRRLLFRKNPGAMATQSAAPRRTHFCPRPAANRAYSSSHRPAETLRSQDVISAFIYNPPIQLKIRLDHCAKISYIVNHIRCKLCG